MAKTNYTKVEEAFNDGLRKIEVDKLLVIADQNSGVKKSSSNQPNQPKLLTLDQKKLIITLKYDIKSMISKNGKEIFQKLGIEKATLDILRKDKDFTDEELISLKMLKDKITSFNEEMNKTPPDEEKTIEKQRKDQKTKRFNINKNWIPLR